eukprot:114496_1
MDKLRAEMIDLKKVHEYSEKVDEYDKQWNEKTKNLLHKVANAFPVMDGRMMAKGWPECVSAAEFAKQIDRAKPSKPEKPEKPLKLTVPDVSVHRIVPKELSEYDKEMTEYKRTKTTYDNEMNEYNKKMDEYPKKMNEYKTENFERRDLAALYREIKTWNTKYKNPEDKKREEEEKEVPKNSAQKENTPSPVTRPAWDEPIPSVTSNLGDLPKYIHKTIWYQSW